MKLYCTSALQEKLGVKYAPSPPPADPLDSWYAHVLPGTQGKSTVLVTLTELQFCVLLPDIGKDQWADLDRRIVSAIQDALHAYDIPPEITERYLPWFARLDRCGAATGSTAARVIAMANQVRKLLRREPDPKKVMDLINSPSAGDAPALALQKLLQERNAPAAETMDGSALELEVSLDLEIYKARRTLIVPAGITFYTLHRCLQEAYRWDDCHLHEFVLEPKKGRKYEQHILDQHTDTSHFPNPRDVQDRDALLKDYLSEGDRFVYTYDFGDNWDHMVRVRRCIPSYPEQLPVCTLSEGAPPPEDVGGVSGFLYFCQVAKNPNAREHDEMLEWAGEDWDKPDPAEAITRRMRNLPAFQNQSS